MIGALVALAAAFASDSYVSASGDDARDGTSPATAWKTVARVNALALRAGDRVLFEGGKTFAGPLRFDRDDLGTRANPIVVGSYGEGRATIDGGTASAVEIAGARGILVRGLVAKGAGRKEGNRQGVGFRLSGASDIRLDDVEASGFQRAGIEMRGCSEVRVTRAYAHDNGYAGISSDGDRSRDITISHSRAIHNPGDPTILDNHSGNGIVLFNVQGATIERCEAAENGAEMPRKGNGPVGIWCASSDRVLIQHCISHHNRSPGHDGGGFDFDGGVTNSVMQFNYSYRNKGWGYLLYEYGSDSAFKGNVVRFCISENDGDAGIGVGEAGARHGFSDCEVYNNVVYNDRGAPGVNLFEGTPRNFFFRNNIFVTKGAPQVRNAGKARFEGNCYWSLGGGFSVDGFDRLEAWSAATGQERLRGELVGLNGDPRLSAPGAGAPTDPLRLGELTGYRLDAGSPAKDRGLDLRARFGLDPGDLDFFGDPPARQGPWPMGVQFAR